MRKILYTLGCIALFFSCKNEQSTTTISVPENPVVEKTASQHYLLLKGTIKDLPITMNLNFHTPREQGAAADKGYYSGSYYYDKYQEPIEVWQSEDSVGMLVLTEKYAYDEENKFIGKFDGTTFSGKWFDGYRQFSFPFTMTVVEENAIAFDYQSFSETYKLDPKKEDSPLAEYSLSALWPRDYKHPEATAFLKKEIMHIIATDSLGQNALTPDEYFNIAKVNYFKAYQSDAAESPEDFTIGNYGADTDLSVVWNTGDLLSLGALVYEYSGGAHGNYGTNYHILDVKNLKVLTEKDVFKPGFEPFIAKALMKSAERTFDSDMNDYTPIDAISKEAVKPNGNFFVTGGGIGYNFVPYEIAAYALGEIQLFLPKNEVREVLQPAFLERMGW